MSDDFAKHPWKHPAVWKDHLVRMTRDYSAGVACSVATCECGWTSSLPTDQHVAQDRAVKDHWHDVIAQSEAAA